VSLNWIYTAISWILLRWHDLWSAVLPGGQVLATNWEWILAILFLVVTIRIILFPLFVKQIRSQRAMQALQPRVKELQQKHKGDRETLQKEMMELYRTEKANPLMGCLPMFLQVPVFIGLFWILRRLNPARPAAVENGEISLDASHITEYGWSLAEFKSASLARLFDAPIGATFGMSPADLLARFGEASGTTVKIVAGVMALMMVVTTYLTSRQMILKTGWSQDPQQRMIQKLMLYGIPGTLLFSGAFFPLGVVLYWVVNNLFSLGQQQWVLRKYPPPPMPGAADGKGGGGRSGGPAGPKPGGPKDGPKPNGAGGGKGRKPADQQAVTGTVDGRSLAPKPGAKPVRPKSGTKSGAKPGGKPARPQKGASQAKG
jgi:YidC/Oxa1 family membrane protein insertase